MSAADTRPMSLLEREPALAALAAALGEAAADQYARTAEHGSRRRRARRRRAAEPRLTIGVRGISLPPPV
jgi:hypothetical protein